MPRTLQQIYYDEHIKTTRDTLDEWSKIIFDNEQSFMSKFEPWTDSPDTTSMELISVAFNSESVKVVFVMGSGQHVTNTYKLDDVLEWAENL